MVLVKGRHWQLDRRTQRNDSQEKMTAYFKVSEVLFTAA